MDLTTYNRMRHYLSKEAMSANESVPSDTFGLKTEIMGWITAVSAEVERFCNRTFLIATHTEYFDARPTSRRFWVKATPISSVTSVYEDSTSLWAGDESQVDDPYLDSEGNSVGIPYRLGYSEVTPRAVRVIYTGGLAYTAANSVFAGVCTTLTAGYWVIGATSGAYGRVVSASSTAVTIEVLRGIFSASETITEYTDETCATASTKTGTITSVTYRSLAEAYPDLVRAVEMEIRYRYKHKSDFELVGNTREGTNLRRRSETAQIPFTDEVYRALLQYRKPHFV